MLKKLVVVTRSPSDPSPPDASDGITIVDITELGDLSAREESLLAEEVDLLPWEKRRFLAVLRALDHGEYLELLGLAPGVSTRELKRAYFELSKQLHPDRYYGKRLGSFAPVLDRVFAALSQFVKTLADSRTVTGAAASPGPSGPRRRRTERVVFHAPVTVAGMTHIGLVQLETIDVSRGGAFLATEATPPVHVGQTVELLVQPTGLDPIALTATVAWVQVNAPSDREEDSPPCGFGVTFDSLEGERAGQLEELVALARRTEPAAVAELAPGRTVTPAVAARVRQATRFARGTARITMARRVVGIDFGTTYTSVAAAVANRVQILPWPDGSRAIPSVLAFGAGGDPHAPVVVGADARARQLRDPRHVVASVKRLLGRRADDPELARQLAQSSFEHGTGPDGSVVIEMFGEQYATPQLCAYLLDAARRNAERVLEQPVEQAVVTVPVSFPPERVQLLRRAGRLAGLDIIEVIEEPNAAALASRHTPGFGGLIGVYDFGGGTFDFSVVEASGGDFRVLTAVGDSWLGGDDLDYAVAEAAANLFWRVHGVDLRMRAVEWQHLLVSSEKAKRDLSVVDAATLFVPEVLHSAQGPQDLRIKVSRERVEPIWQPVIERSLNTCVNALGLLGLRPGDLTAIYLAGGTSYVPAVRRALSHQFQVPVRIGAPPDHAVCLGAGIHAAQLERRIPTLLAPR